MVVYLIIQLKLPINSINFFVNIEPDLAAKIPPVTPNIHITDIMPVPNSSSMFIEPCTAYEVVSIINDLKNSKDTGVDGFRASVIKSVSLNIAHPLIYIFNKSFATGIFHDMLKTTEILTYTSSEVSRCVARSTLKRQ